MSDEIWKTISDYPLYEVSSIGNVRRKLANMKPGKLPSGHLTVALSNGDGNFKSLYVHRLVALAFINNSENKLLVNHKNGNPNDNRVDNLEWCTYSENITHGYRSNGRRVPSEMRIACIDDSGELFASFRSIRDASKLFGVAPGSIASAIKRSGSSCGYKWVKL